jgi:hypothetical protein
VSEPGTELFEYVCQQSNFADELMVGEGTSVDRAARSSREEPPTIMLNADTITRLKGTRDDDVDRATDLMKSRDRVRTDTTHHK